MEELFSTLGFQLLAAPNSDVKPKMLLCKSGINKAERLNANLDSLFIEGEKIPYPITKLDIVHAEFSGKSVVDIHSSFGVKLLASLAQAVGLKDVGAGATWNGKDKAIFSFKEMREDNINLVKLDEYIQDADVNQGAASFIDKLENSDLYIVTAILRCKEFSIETVDYSLLKLDASATANEILEAHANFEREHTKRDGISYKGEVPLTIALKAVQITYNKPFWKSKKDAKYRIKPVSGLTVKDGVEYLTEDVFLEI